MANNEDIKDVALDVVPGYLAVLSIAALSERLVERLIEVGHHTASIGLVLEQEDDEEDLVDNTKTEHEAPEDRMRTDEGSRWEHKQAEHENEEDRRRDTSLGVDDGRFELTVGVPSIIDQKANRDKDRQDRVRAVEPLHSDVRDILFISIRRTILRKAPLLVHGLDR